MGSADLQAQPLKVTGVNIIPEEASDMHRNRLTFSTLMSRCLGLRAEEALEVASVLVLVREDRNGLAITSPDTV